MPCLILDSELLDLTKRAVDSIKKTTRDYELIIIDNASPIGRDYLVSVADTYQRNEINNGNAGAWNDGLALATGDTITLSDNDICLTDGWQSAIIKALKDEKNGIVFPLSRNKEDDGYKYRTVGFFWTLRREVLGDVGKCPCCGEYICTKYLWGNFEDDDYFMRVLDKGYKIFVTKNAKVDHYSRATCDKIPEIAEVWTTNRDIFYKKFGGRTPMSYLSF